MGTARNYFWEAPTSLQMVTAAMKFKEISFFGRKAMTHLDSILKSRDITLPTKVCLVKAMVFPIVMYGCEIWTIKKAECWRTDALVLEKTLERPLEWKEIKPVNPKRNQSWIFIGMKWLILKLKLQYFGYLMQRIDSFENILMLGKIECRRRGQQKMRWLDGITDNEKRIVEVPEKLKLTYILQTLE